MGMDGEGHVLATENKGSELWKLPSRNPVVDDLLFETMGIHEIEFKETKLRQADSRRQIPRVAELIETASAERLESLERRYPIQILEAWTLHVDDSQPRGGTLAGNGHKRKPERDCVVNIVAQIDTAAQDIYEVRGNEVEGCRFIEDQSFYPLHDRAVLERPHNKLQAFVIWDQERAVEELVAKTVP